MTTKSKETNQEQEINFLSNPLNKNLADVLDKMSPPSNQDFVLYDINIKDIFLILRRRAEVIYVSIFLFLGLAVFFLFIAQSKYTSQAVLQVNSQKSQVVNIESVLTNSMPEELQIQSQVDILTSRNIAGQVVDALNLVRDSDFSPNTDSEKTEQGLFSFLSFNKVADRNSKEDIRSYTINNVLKKLSVSRNQKSYTIVVNFTSKSPEKSALIANTFVDKYLENQLSTKFEATERANDWLNKKITDLHEKVKESETNVQSFREENDLVETAGRTVTDQQLAELNTQLVLAGAERAQAEAKLQGLKDMETSADVLRSPLIQSLRNQEAEVMRKVSDLSSQYGPRHPKIVNVTAELRDLRGKISLEINKIKSSLENDLYVTKSHEASIKQSLDELQNKTGISKKAKIELDELERQKNANNSLYEIFLSRFKETSEGIGLEQPDAFVISKAETPVVPSFPNKLSIIAGAIFIGLFSGIGLAFLLEHLDDVVNSSKQAEELTNIDTIGMIPELEDNQNPVAYLIKRPSSVFAESLRSVLTSVQFSNPDNPPKVIMATSSVPKEGKSLFVLMLASLAALSGKKILLIDCDLKRPKVGKFMKKDTEPGLVDYLTGKATEKQCIHNDDRTGLHYIPASPNTVNSNHLLNSAKMKDLIANMREKYDLVILDTPPIMAISDGVVLSKIVDTTLFIIRWNKSKRDIIKSAIKQINSFNVNMAGTVITRVDLEKQSKYGQGDRGYYYKNYSEYYVN